MKLQKLVYYSQAWSLVWEEESLIDQDFQAWRNGPVCPELYEAHRGLFKVSYLRGAKPGILTDNQRETVDAVLEHYGKYDAQYLSDLTHMEDPWQVARGELEDHENCQEIITLAMMHEYYSGLL